jgi:hypothetical protein
MLDKEITQASKLNKSKLYSFHDRTVHVRGGIYRGPSLCILHKMTILPLTQIVTTLFNYKSKVVFFLSSFHSSAFGLQSSRCLRILDLVNSYSVSFSNSRMSSEVKSLSSLGFSFFFVAKTNSLQRRQTSSCKIIFSSSLCLFSCRQTLLWKSQFQL